MTDRRSLTVAALLLSAVVTAASACDGSDPGPDAGADVVAWCEQLDAAFRASAGIAELDRDDPALDGALATVQDEMAALVDLEAPPAIAADWRQVSGPPPTDDTGSFEVDGEFAAAGERIATWALVECDLSSGARDALEEQADG